MMDLMFKHAKEPPPPMSKTLPGMPNALDAPVLQMLHKDPARRPASVSAAVEALADAARGTGFNVPKKKRSTGDESRPGLLEKSGMGQNSKSFGEAATVAEPPPGHTGEAAARTLNTVETSVDTGGGGSSKTLMIALAALVVGIGVTVAITSSNSGETNALGSPSAEPATPAAPGNTSAAATETAPAAETTAETSASPPASASVPAVAANPPPTSVPAVPKLPAPKSIPSPKTAPPPKVSPKPANTTPPDLSSPFDE